jgi:hypothetical protein
MTGVGGAPPAPMLTPVGRRGRGPWAWLVLGLFAAAMVALVGSALVGQSGGGFGFQAAVSEPTASRNPSSTAEPVTAPSPSATPEPFRGTPLPRTGAAAGPVAMCPPGSTPDQPGLIDQARPPQNPPAAIAFDRRTARLVALVGAEGGVETWTFDVCTNTWAQMHPNPEPGDIDGWDTLVYDVDSDVSITVDRLTGHVWTYDLGADAWTEKGVAPIGMTLEAYDPLTGLVVGARGVDPTETWDYDVETDTWTPIPLASSATDSPPPGGPFAYDASADRIVAYAEGATGGETWLFDIRTGTWARSAAETPGVVGWMVAPGIVYDEAAERTVIYRRVPLTAYDSTRDRWEVLAVGDTPWSYPDSMVYDPVNRRLVGLGQRGIADGGIVDQSGVAALDLATGEWTVLLEPGGVPATPP